MHTATKVVMTKRGTVNDLFHHSSHIFTAASPNRIHNLDTPPRVARNQGSDNPLYCVHVHCSLSLSSLIQGTC